MDKKPPLLLIHGLRGNHLGLTTIARHLEKAGYEVYVPDLPPAGGQTLPEYTAESYAKFIGDYILKLKLDHPVLIGHSLGSIVATATASMFPELIGNEIILLSPISNQPRRIFAALTPATAILPNKPLGFITTKYLYVPESEADLREILDITYRCGSDYTTRRAVQKSAKFSAKHSIANFPLKDSFDITFISGAEDHLIPRKETDALAHRLGAKTVYIKNSGHLINYEKPKEVADAILEALAE